MRRADEDNDARLFREIYPSLRRHAAIVGSRHDDPDDLVQEALARTLARTPLDRIERPAAYLRRTITNLVIDRSRRRDTANDRRHLIADDTAGSDHYPSDLDLLDHLDPVDRVIVYLVDVEGHPFGDAAHAVGCSSGAARLRASRARRNLRNLLKNDPAMNRLPTNMWPTNEQ